MSWQDLENKNMASKLKMIYMDSTCPEDVKKELSDSFGDIKGVRKWFGDFDRMIGLTNLKLINLNDSKPAGAPQ